MDGQEKSCIKRDFKECIPETGFGWMSKRSESATWSKQTVTPCLSRYLQWIWQYCFSSFSNFQGGRAQQVKQTSSVQRLVFQVWLESSWIAKIPFPLQYYWCLYISIFVPARSTLSLNVNFIALRWPSNSSVWLVSYMPEAQWDMRMTHEWAHPWEKRIFG